MIERHTAIKVAATSITPKMYFFNTWKMILDEINKRDIA